MKATDKLLDMANPDVKDIKTLIDYIIRNRLCFDELSSFERTGQWLMKHPFLKYEKKVSKLIDLKTNKPDEFINQATNAKMYKKRYKYLINKANEPDKKERYQQLYNQYVEIDKIISDLMND